MKCRRLLKAGLLTLTLSIGSLIAQPIYAQGIMDDITYEETTEDYSEETNYGIMGGMYLNYGSATVTKKSENEVVAFGRTQCHRMSEKVELTICLERKVDGVYSTYKSWDFSKTSATSLGREIVVIVPKNYYYRVRTFHAAESEGIRETTAALTKGVKIGG